MGHYYPMPPIRFRKVLFQPSMLLQKNGHLVFINTGRTIRTMPSFLKTLGFDGYLCGCGTRIVYHDEILLAHSFTEEEGQLLIDLMDKWAH